MGISELWFNRRLISSLLYLLCIIRLPCLDFLRQLSRGVLTIAHISGVTPFT